MNTVEIPGGFIVPNDSHIGSWQQECGKLDHDDFLLPIALLHIKPGMTVLDCGAFDGDHTIAYSRAVGASGKVIAVEAGDLAYHCLNHNARRFENRNVIPVHAAVESMAGFLFAHYENPNLGASRVRCDQKIVSGRDFIYSVSIDSLRHHFKVKFDFIKLDIEGYEALALLGAVNCLEDDRPILLIEINSEALSDNGASPNDVVGQVEKHGYDWQPVQSTCTIDSPQFDIICTPRP